jgi:hypothetical protein
VNAAAACPSAYSVASTIERRRLSCDAAISLSAAMWSQSNPCRKPRAKAVATRARSSPVLAATTRAP